MPFSLRFFFSVPACGTVFFLFVFIPTSAGPACCRLFSFAHTLQPRATRGRWGGCAKALTVTLKGIRPTRPAFFASPSEANANRRTSGEMETKTKSKKENHMEPSKKNLKKSQARVEAPLQSVQSAKWVADQIGGIPEYQAKVVSQILKVCAAFGGRIVGVTL